MTKQSALPGMMGVTKKQGPHQLVLFFEDAIEKRLRVRPILMATKAAAGRERGAAKKIIQACDGDYDLACAVVAKYAAEATQLAKYATLLVVNSQVQRWLLQVRVEKRQAERGSFKDGSGMQPPTKRGSFKRGV
jgi:hypothetical protein